MLYFRLSLIYIYKLLSMLLKSFIAQIKAIFGRFFRVPTNVYFSPCF